MGNNPNIIEQGKATRFPHNDPRKGGRPVDVWKESFNKVLLNETGYAFYDAEILDENGKPTGQKAKVRVKLPKLELLVQTAAKKALKGDMRAMNIIMDRMSGKPTQSIEHSGEIKTADVDYDKLTKAELKTLLELERKAQIE